MAIRRMRERKAAVATAAAAALLAGGIGAYAAIPADDGTITACYDSGNVVRVLDTATSTGCPAGQTKLTWSQRGFGRHAAYSVDKDGANGYEVGDTAYLWDNRCGTGMTGTFVKIRKVANTVLPCWYWDPSSRGWARVASDGGQGPTGPRGFKGDPGPNNVHWAKFDANGRFLGASDPGTEHYANSNYALVKFPNVDMNKCAITVQPVAADGDPAISTYSNWYGWIYARTQRITASGPRNNGLVALDIVANCGMSMNP